MTFRPMLAGKADLGRLKFPVLASRKIDGIRCLIRDGVALGRSLKPLPNKHLQALLGRPELNGLDGEIVVGPANSPTAYRDTNSGVMSIEGVPDLTYLVFDRWDLPGDTFEDRLAAAFPPTVDHDAVKLLIHRYVTRMDELRAFQARVLAEGYEGVMLRSCDGPYKNGRSSTNEGYLLKLKEFTTSEALVVGLIEEMANLNEATTNALGFTERSSHRENKVGKSRLGALQVRDTVTGVEFAIGTGFTAADRESLWNDPPIGRVVSYSHFEIGTKDLPRFPVFRGFREDIDMEVKP